MQDLRRRHNTASALNNFQMKAVHHPESRHPRNEKNRYDRPSDTLKLTDAQVYGLHQVRDHYRKVFTKETAGGLSPV
ncbi:hypothetical protein PO124_13250 [Bacillus licheniformis]|nr:hypothetical protein [Bacillus licheniformis]